MGVWSLSLRSPKQTAEAKIGGPMLQATSLNELEPILYLNVRKAHWGNSERFHSYTLSLEEKLTNGFRALASMSPRMVHHANQAHVEN